MSPPWLVHLAECLLSREPKRRIRLARTGWVQHAADELIAHLIEPADVALYRAASQGRNRVVAMPASAAATSSAPPGVR